MKGVSVGEPAEVFPPAGRGGAPRVCIGRMLAADTSEYPLDYSSEWRQGQVIVHIEVR